jgi:hypothetical protein
LLNRRAATFAIARNREFRDLLAGKEIPLVGDPDDLPAQAALTEYPATVAPSHRRTVAPSHRRTAARRAGAARGRRQQSGPVTPRGRPSRSGQFEEVRLSR